MELGSRGDGSTLLLMRGYGQFCTVARAAEVFGERWTPLVVREILCGSQRFNDIRRGVPRMSPTLLAQIDSSARNSMRAFSCGTCVGLRASMSFRANDAS